MKLQKSDARVRRTRRDVERAALEVLLAEGRGAVSQQRVAADAGYSRATVYKHWPTRTTLLCGAFARLGDVEHHEPSGALRSDLIDELTVFRRSMQHDRLDRALAVLADLSASEPDLAAVRDKLVADGERVVRAMLAGVLSDTHLEAATLMLCGAVLHSALMHGRLPDDELIAAAVDLTLGGLAAPAEAGAGA